MAIAIPRVSITLPNGATAAVASTTQSPNVGVYGGMLASIKVVTPNFTNTITTIVKLYDRNGVLLWSSGSLAENSGAAGYYHAVSIPLTYGEYFTATPSGDPGAGGGIVTIDCDIFQD